MKVIACYHRIAAGAVHAMRHDVIFLFTIRNYGEIELSSSLTYFNLFISLSTRVNMR
jgi:hypothetical protein